MSQLFSAMLIILGFFFFTAQLAPYGGDFSAISFSAYGIGSISIALVLVVIAYRSGRQSQRRFPDSRSSTETALRAFFMVLPFWIGCLALFLASTLHTQNALFGDVTLGPSSLGLITPLVLIGGAASLGAVHERRPALSSSSVFALRGVVLALFAIGMAIAGSLIGGIVALVLNLATHSSLFNTNSNGASSPTLPQSGQSSGGPSPATVLFGLAVAVFFVLNALLWLWGTALGLRFESVGWLILVFGVAGALIGALPIRRRPGATEQITFALTFGFGSFLIALISRPTLGAYAFGADPLTTLIAGVVVGGAIAFAAPYAAVTSLGRSLLALRLMRFAVAMLPLPELGAVPGTPSPAPNPTDAAQQPAQMQIPTIQFGKRARIATAVIVVLIIGAVGANFYLSAQTTADAAAVAYVNAVGSNNADAIWGHISVRTQNSLPTFGAPANTPQLLSESDLKAMLSISQNTHQTRTSISVGQSVVSGDNATVSVSYVEAGQQHSDTLALIHDHTSNQYLFYPNWKVLQAPGFVGVNLPTPNSQVAIDNADLPAGVNGALVLPGTHKVTLLASGPFASTDQLEAVQPGLPAAVTFQNLSLTPAAQAAGLQSIQSFFTTCAQQTSASSGNCPQQLNQYISTPVTWQLVGDPSKDAAFSVDPGSQGVQAVGHFLMTAKFTSDSGPEDRVSGGPYALSLTWGGSSFSVQGLAFATAQPTPLPDPGAAQSAILAAVKTGWQNCLKTTSLGPPDCPFSTYGLPSPTGVKWSATPDPMASALVAWDGTVGIYKVTGNYSLSVTYSTAYGQQQQSANGSYTAEVLWDGQKATLVDIQ